MDVYLDKKLVAKVFTNEEKEVITNKEIDIKIERINSNIEELKKLIVVKNKVSEKVNQLIDEVKILEKDIDRIKSNMKKDNDKKLIGKTKNGSYYFIYSTYAKFKEKILEVLADRNAKAFYYAFLLVTGVKE